MALTRFQPIGETNLRKPLIGKFLYDLIEKSAAAMGVPSRLDHPIGVTAVPECKPQIVLLGVEVSAGRDPDLARRRAANCEYALKPLPLGPCAGDILSTGLSRRGAHARIRTGRVS